MISSSDFRRGLKVMYEGEPWAVVEFQHVKVARGRPHVKAKMKNMLKGNIIEKSFLTTESFDVPDLVENKMQFLYSQGDEYVFMDSKTFDQITVEADTLGNTRWYLMENEEYGVLLYEGNALSVNLPASVILVITETEPGVKGDSVSNIMKPAVVETGLKVKVPLFIKEGDKVKIDTRTGEYIERAN